MTTRVASFFSESKITRIVGQRTLWRAQMIQREAIENVEASDDRVTATVRGSLPYRTELWVDEKLRPNYSCTCPQGDDGKFCKHCAALALTLHENSNSPIVGAPQKDPQSSPAPEIVNYVESLSREELVNIVLDASTRDGVTAQRIVLQKSTGTLRATLDVKLWRSQITAAFGPKSRFIDYRAAPHWAQNILGLIEELRDAIDDGSAGDAIGLLEHAFTRTERAMQHIDDSDGWITMIAGDIGDAHLRACQRARPAPKGLARRLVGFELDYDLDTFRGAAEPYAEVLGDEGIKEYRRLIKEAQARVDVDTTGGWSSPMFRIRHACIGIALATGDIEELITQLTTEPMLPTDCLVIVNALMAADRVTEAIEWAHRGLNAPKSLEQHRRELRDRLVGILIDRGDLDEARAVLLQGFQSSPSPESLRRYLAACTDHQRAAERRALLEWLEQRAATEHPAPQSANDLTRILLAEGEIDAAYDAASRFGCGIDLRHTLARAIEKSRPREAIALHQLEIDELIDRKKRQDYQSAAALLERVRRLYEACDAEAEWTTYVGAVAAIHKAKSSFIAILRQRHITSLS